MRNSYFLFTILFLLGCSKSSGNVAPEPLPLIPPVTTMPENKVVAHRGAWKEFDLPENSVAALEKAMELSCSASECDIQMTKDNQVIVYHDEQIGGKYFKDLNYADIVNRTLSNGEKVPLLSDFLKIIVANKKLRLWIDVKSLSDAAGGNDRSIQAAKTAAALVREAGAQKYVSFIVGRKAVLDESLQASNGEWPCAYMNVDYSPENFISKGYGWANFSYNKFYTNTSNNNAALIDDYSSKGLKVTVYTVDDDAAMSWFLSKSNIAAITTNYPFKLLQKAK